MGQAYALVVNLLTTYRWRGGAGSGGTWIIASMIYGVTTRI